MHLSTRFVAVTAAVATSTALAVTSASAAVPTDTSALRQAVTVEGIMAHEYAFQAIADANNDNRASGTPGYDASAAYVIEQLESAGYDVTQQFFDFAFFSENAPAEFERISPDPETFVLGDDFFTMEYSGSGDVTGVLIPVDVQIAPTAPANTSTSGCEATDFDGLDFSGPNDVALIQRGTCTFALKATNAEAAGAEAVIIFNEGQDGRTDVINGTLGGPGVTIPVIGASFAVGEELYLQTLDGPVVVRVFTSTTSEIRSTSNVIADTPGGRSDRTVVVGAHLDSVPEGPGIQDNGSGSATILEIALQMDPLDVRNKVRFAFWGAEESGLLGSEYYVSQLSERQIKDIAVNLNFDMVASPNYGRFVYDGDGSDTELAGPNGSANVEDVFTDYFDSQGLASEPTEFSGRSDYGPFIAVGIPAGGLFTGAEETKEEYQVALYGGLATFNGEPVAYDPCYHLACDSLEQDGTEGFDPALYAALDAAYGGALVGNVNTLALDEMSDAAAHAVLTFAMTTSAVNGTSQGGGSNAAAGSQEFKGHRQQN